jgi:hypothetical protein
MRWASARTPSRCRRWFARRPTPEGSSPAYFVSSAHLRLVDGKPSKNPRYLQLRPGSRPPAGDVRRAARAVLQPPAARRRGAVAAHPRGAAGRRNNLPEAGIRPLCVFNPLHYLELPELFMEFISSMTGKSPSTTGAGSEGALTKGPFNALPAIIDLNAALVSFILTGHDGWVSCAGFVGPQVRVDHDISLLVPEVFARMSASERSAKSLIAEGCKERLADFEHRGSPVLASRLGYRVTSRFVHGYFGRVFTHPHAVFTDEMLRPNCRTWTSCRRHGQHRRDAPARGAELLRRRQPGAGLPAAARAAGDHGAGPPVPATACMPEVRDLFTRESLLASVVGVCARRQTALTRRAARTASPHSRTSSTVPTTGR